ncbi:MAG: 50S ribosomal protein L6 [Bacteroidetes bacterium CG23_combo_of_CG06-09_8_20_14_all_32_9]|nr:MAG: 50S ribosomal protein L6 [Bacteroidetes bacterium CG23_combo_of_CG06-09_8_20_14_all_32_9]
MSRVGKLPINIPPNVKISFNDGQVVVKGPLGELKQNIDKEFNLNISGNAIIVERPSEQKKHKAFHGLYRALINNMVIGVSQGFTIKQEIVGVGYKAEANGQLLKLNLGYSHEIVFEIPEEVSVTAVTERRANPIISLTSIDKQLLGQVAAKIRSLRKPEPYKGKGIKFVGEKIRRKAGKSASAK